jgi:hypothetical protein
VKSSWIAWPSKPGALISITIFAVLRTKAKAITAAARRAKRRIWGAEAPKVASIRAARASVGEGDMGGGAPSAAGWRRIAGRDGEARVGDVGLHLKLEPAFRATRS